MYLLYWLFQKERMPLYIFTFFAQKQLLLVFNLTKKILNNKYSEWGAKENISYHSTFHQLLNHINVFYNMMDNYIKPIQRSILSYIHIFKFCEHATCKVIKSYDIIDTNNKK